MRRLIPRLFYINTSRWNSIRALQNLFCFVCILFALIQYACIEFFNRVELPSAQITRLHPDVPLSIDLRPYSVCHPQEYALSNITEEYHRHYSNRPKQVCFLVDQLDGGPWWSYVSHEFGEILAQLKKIGRKFNVDYRPFPNHTKFDYDTNLTHYVLHACDINENLPKEDQPPIVVLLWDVNHLLWHRMHEQWSHLTRNTRLRLLAFIDDNHFESKEIFTSRQYLFQSVASEILAAYPYLFHNYYINISSEKITWLPHSASALSERTINQTAEHVLFVSGANMFDWYPCRSRAFSLCFTRNDFVSCLKHPGYGPTKKDDNEFYYTGQRYFAYMKRFVFGLATCQSVHYAIAKLFELPANGLALVTTEDLVPILERLHLHRNEHFLTVDCSSKQQLASEIARIRNISRADVLQMRRKSQDLIFDRHLTKHRAELLHVRLLAHALSISKPASEKHRQWKQWGRSCH